MKKYNSRIYLVSNTIRTRLLVLFTRLLVRVALFLGGLNLAPLRQRCTPYRVYTLIYMAESAGTLSLNGALTLSLQIPHLYPHSYGNAKHKIAGKKPTISLVFDKNGLFKKKI